MARLAQSTAITLILILFSLLTIFVNGADHPKPSSSHCYTCPDIDDESYALGATPDALAQTSGGGVLTCCYPRYQGDQSSICEYSKTSGKLVYGDDNCCPPRAMRTSCDKNGQDDNFKAMKRRAAARAAQPRSSRSN